MAQDILQSFLTARMFSVGGDDSRLDKLRSAAADVADLIKATPARAAGFTMVALDADCRADEPILAEVASKVEKHWNSYTGSFAEDVLPVVLRAVILDALARIVGSDPIAMAVALTARNLSPYVGDAADQPLWVEILNQAERRLELRARREWTMPSTAEMEPLKLELGETTPINAFSVNLEYLIKHLAGASGPSGADGVAIEGANQNWPNNGPQWSYEFAPRAAKAIAAVTNSALKSTVDAINKQAGHATLIEAIGAYIQQAAAAVAKTSVGLERRTALIWWKEALYSPGAERSYREMDLALAAGWMAIDGAEQAGSFAPRMAEAVILETMRSLAPEDGLKPRALTDLAAELLKEQDIAIAARERLACVLVEKGRTPLASLISHNTPIDGNVVHDRLGLDADVQMSPAAFALWLYREYQVAIATQSAAKGRRKAKS